MMSRFFLSALALTALSACAPQVPDSSASAGYDNSRSVQQSRDQALAGANVYADQPQTVLPPASAVSSGPLDPTGIGGYDTASATAAETQRVLIETRPELGAEIAPATAPVAPAPVAVTPALPAPEEEEHSRISDENDFSAVAQRETIESDKARIAANAAQYQVIQPEALPARTGEEGPNIVAYALSTHNAVGQRVYSRPGFSSATRAARNCAKYASSDQAQMDFLGRGGPQKDGKGLDPDGDGFACSWDPSPFRKAAQG